ncbi:MAG: sugar ABC transporter permease [Treponema sp.]|jgi:multiple sugar transport system permease protein|nr:sugar ABC transporter permease [Treponema sp.]
MDNHQSQSLSQWSASYTGQKYLTTILFLLIPVVLLVLFTAIPAINMVFYSFLRIDRFGLHPEFVGFQNYVDTFTRSDTLSPLQNSLYYMGGSFVQLTIAIIVASILCTRVHFSNIFKGIIFFPYMMNGVAVSIIFRKFFSSAGGINASEGILNSILLLFGVQPHTWLSASPILANICLVFVSNWRYIGFDIIMFIGAIQSISPEIFEASSLDGVNGWQRFKYIIFPSIRPIIALQLILSIRGAVSVFEVPYIVTNGMNHTETFVMKTVDTAFKLDKFGLASAMGIVLLLIIVVITLIQKAFFKEEA